MKRSPLGIVGFEKGAVLRAAEGMGFFAAEGLDVTFTQTRSSKEEITGLLEGTWDVAFDNADNVIAWDEGYGADRRPHDLFIFMGGSRELNQSLYGTSDIWDISQLRGKVLGVDAVDTGYAVVLRYILQRHGLGYEQDYRLIPLGSTRARLENLLEGRISGAMLNSRTAESHAELRLLARGRDYVHPYASRVGLARRVWAELHHDVLVRFIRANLTAADWLAREENEAAALGLVSDEQGCARQQLKEEIGNLRALGRSALAIDREALDRVIAVRTQAGIGKARLPAAEKYFDNRFFKTAASRPAASLA
ncbi:MAG TPA: ABC transporter substrate-binding protein [Candidatus Eisenbacteria bacterium]|nr:ABC transporter substrate-binding protein [Candidatus Eisenbacteria bacterium]